MSTAGVGLQPHNEVILAQLKVEQLKLDLKIKELQLTTAEREKREHKTKVPNSSLDYSEANAFPHVPMGIPNIPLQRLDPKDNIDTYLCSFEEMNCVKS